MKRNSIASGNGSFVIISQKASAALLLCCWRFLQIIAIFTGEIYEATQTSNNKGLSAGLLGLSEKA